MGHHEHRFAVGDELFKQAEHRLLCLHIEVARWLVRDNERGVIGQGAGDGGSLLLAAGEKGMRFSLPNSRIMVHQPSGGFQGQASDIALHAKEILELKDRLNKIYVKHTAQDLKTVEDALDRDNFMTAEEAKGWGLIDEIVEERKATEES